MIHLFRFTGQTFVEIHFCPSSGFHVVVIPNDLFATSCTDQHILFLCLLFFSIFPFFNAFVLPHCLYKFLLVSNTFNSFRPTGLPKSPCHISSVQSCYCSLPPPFVAIGFPHTALQALSGSCLASQTSQR